MLNITLHLVCFLAVHGKRWRFLYIQNFHHKFLPLRPQKGNYKDYEIQFLFPYLKMFKQRFGDNWPYSFYEEEA